MKGTDRMVLLALPLLALVAAFWFLVLSPKREEAAELADEVATLEASVAAQEQLASDAEAAKDTFPVNYRKLVVLGKAVPEDADTSSLLVQLNRTAARSGVEFSTLSLAQTSSEVAPPPAPEATTPADAAEDSEQDVAAAEAGTAAPVVLPTESAVANLPLGAAVGPAGLPTMPYELGFSGDFFDITDFIGRLDDQVGLRSDGVPSVYGRLITIDGFSLSVNEGVPGSALATPNPASPGLQASFVVTTFLTPESQGLTAGATPAGPPTGPQPVSADPSVPAPPVASSGTSLTGGTR